MKIVSLSTWKRLGAMTAIASLLTAFVFLFLLPQNTQASPRQDVAQAAAADDLIITAAYDGPLTGGTPKGVELYVVNDIPDLSIYGLGSANNGGGTDGEEFTFPADTATAGDFIYVASESPQFTAFFGFAPDYTSGGAMGINGDDAVELFTNGSVSDIFGDINVDGTGQPWEYLDGWAYRNDETGPDGTTFVLSNWSFSGPNALDGETTNAAAATPVPIGTYIFAAPSFSISKDVLPSSIGYQENVTYTVVLENETAVSDTNVLFTDTLPAEVDFASWVEQPAGASVTADEITWSGTVTATDAITFTFIVSHTGNYGDVVTNTASFSGTLITGTAEAVFTVATDTPDMTASKTGPSYAVTGDTIVYTVTVGNEGGGMATGWAITDTLPISVTYVSSNYTVSPVTSTVGSRETLVWSDTGNWTGGFTETFNITATINASITNGTIITNDIEISTSTIGDPLDNNSDQFETAVYPLVSIYDIQQVITPTAASDYDGQTVWVEGVVTAESNEFGSYIVVEDPAGGAWSGLPLYLSGIPAAAEGDYLRAVGVVVENFGLTRLALLDADAVQKMGTMAVPAPAVINTNDYADAATAEQWEAVYIEFQDATVTDPDLGFGEWAFDDGSGASRADDLGSITYNPILGDAYNYIRGIGWYSYSNYKLAPRYDADIAFDPFIAKSASALVDPGQLYTYTLTVDNRVGYDLNNVVITDSLPISSTFAYASDGGTYDTGVISWTVSTVGNWTTVERTFAVTATAVVGAEIVNVDYAFQADNWITVTMGSPITTTVSANACGEAYTSIYDIQGNGAGSPVDGDAVFTEGVITAVYQGADQLNGFYIQDESGDGDDTTSDGIFVYTSMTATAGDAVRVAGTVDEFYGLTEITDVSSVLVCGIGTITPTAVSLPIATLDTWEQYEGMLLEFPQGLYATETYNLGRYGEVSLSVDDRLYNPTNITTPGAAAIAQQELNDRSRVQLDDTYTNQNRDPITYPGAGLSYTNTLRGGDYVANLTGVLDYAFGDYKIQPVGAVDFTVANTRTVAAEDVGGNLRVASFNVLNYFNGDGQGGGFPTSRGADTPTEFVRQRVKIVNAIIAMDADIIGLMEIENDGYGSFSAIQDLVNGLNDVTAAGTYAFVDAGAPIGTDEIAVGLIYKTTGVTLAGSPQILDSTVISTFNDLKNRPVLAQSFTDNTSGKIVTIAVNHFKSKGSSCDSIDDPDTGDGQGNCNLTRTSASEALATWLATDPTSSGSAYNLIIGDLNAYAMEDPITALQDAGYNNLLSDFGGLYAYSYVYAGQHGYLDHALSSPALTPFVTGATTWHINSDEPRSLDYNEEFKTANQLITLYGEGPYRASDHDPVVVGLRFNFIYLPIIMK